MVKRSFKLMPPERIRYMVEMAEQARVGLSRFVGYQVDYDSTALQLLDEWIDRHVRQFPNPSQRMRLLWVSFLGEMFRRGHRGEWVIRRDGKGDKMIVICPLEGGEVREVDVSGQVGLRIAQGISASLAYFYAVTSIELRAGGGG